MSDPIPVPKPIELGEIVYSLDDLQHGYGEEATVVEIHETKGPSFVPARLYTLKTKSGGILDSMMRSEFSRNPPKPRIAAFTHMPMAVPQPPRLLDLR